MDSGGTKIRRATRADVPALIAMLTETWHATYDPILGSERAGQIIAVWNDPSYWTSFIPGSSLEITAVGEQNGEIVAMALARLITAFELRLFMLYVRPEFQRRGLGCSLVAFVLDPFPTAGSITLEVLHANVQATAFYAAQGFVREGEVRNAQSTGVPALTMRKSIAGRRRILSPFWDRLRKGGGTS